MDTDAPLYDIFVIPDAHAAPGQDMTRFTLMGKLAALEAATSLQMGRRFAIVCIGDWADLASISSYDKGKASAENRRMNLDLAASRQALDLFMAELDRLPTEKRETIELHMTLGNHEHRISRLVNDQPALIGTLQQVGGLGFKDHGWTIHPFLQPVELAGILFAHYFPSGVMGRAIGGKTAAETLLTVNMKSSVVGHSHLLKYAQRTGPDGRTQHAMQVGCAFEHHEHWAGPANNFYWRGVVMLRNARDGDFDYQVWRLSELRRMFGVAPYVPEEER